MSLIYGRWPSLPPEMSGAISRRAEELFNIRDALEDEGGLVECSVLPLKDVVLFPNLLTPLFVSHEPTLAAVEEAIRKGETMVSIAQLDPDQDNPGSDDLYRVGTEVAVGRLMHIPDGSISLMTQGRRRIEVLEYIQTQPYLRVRGRPVDEGVDKSKETIALMRAVQTLFEKCIELNRTLPEEVLVYALNIEEPGWLADLICSALDLRVPERQAILELFDPVVRLQEVSVLLGRELDVLELEDQIHSQVQNEVDRTQREIYLREQMKAIQSELGEGDLWAQEIKDIQERIEHLSLPEDVEVRALKELQRLGQMPPMSPEVGIIRTYLDWLIELPWTVKTDDNLDLAHAAEVLESQHYALDDAKDRILEYIAVKSLAPSSVRQPILCFVGPPGTGKTSLGRSISDALGREFIRHSLGGIRDEAEIRGHRRTYIGALPGRILQSIRKGGTRNPLFMLDEVDKLGRDFRGDPASALLEVLDPEQNNSFSDHYLELAFDLSDVMFITTANTLDPIPPALLDRMEVIEFPGYIESEKVLIAQKFLIGRQLEQNGLGKDELAFNEPALRGIIRQYTWESGVRNLEREIGKICRKTARRKAERKKVPRRITVSMLSDLLGPPQIVPHRAETIDQVGAATGLAWTENGGDSITVEALIVEGKGGLQITGQIGEVMQESAQAALSYIKSLTERLKIEPEVFDKTDIHIHIPEGAIPKDGPSAGITMASAVASALTGWAIRREVGMTGEITLRGRVLSVGGVREKIHAARRMRLSTIILPRDNQKDLVKISRQELNNLDVRLVDSMDEVLDIALISPQVASPMSAKKRKQKESRSTANTATSQS